MIAIMACTFVFAIRAATTPINGDPLHSFVDDKAAIRLHLNQANKFGDDSGKAIIVAANEGDDLFSAAKLNAIRAAKDSILAIDEVQAVTSIVDAYRSNDPNEVRNIKTVAKESAARQQLLDGLIPDVEFKAIRYWPESKRKQSKISMKRLKADAMADDRLNGTLLSSDGLKHSMLIAVHPNIQLSIPRQQSLWKEIQVVLKENGVGEQGVYVAGLPITNAAIGQQIQSAFAYLMPFGFAIVAAFIFLVYRQLKIAGLIVVIGLTAVVWSLGLTSLVYGEITILVAAAPLVILAVSTTDFLHITTAYQLALQNNRDHETALTEIMIEVGGACVLTSLTTFVGFASLMLTHSTSVRQFGFACATGTSVALLLMVTLLPITYRIIKPAIGSIDSNRVYRWIDRVIAQCSFASQRYPLWIFLFSLAICIPGSLMILEKPIDTDIPGRFSKNHPLRKSIVVLEEEFSGANSIDFYITGKPDDLLSHSFNRSLQTFIQNSKSEPEVLNSVSVLDIYGGIEDSISYRTGDGLPPNSIAAKTSLKWVEKIEPAFVKAVATENYDELRIRIMVQSKGFQETNQLANRLASSLKRAVGDKFNVSVGGTYTLIGVAAKDIIQSQIFGFGICVASLTLILIWGLGSWRVGILSQIPNLIPVLLMVAVVAFTLNRLDSDLLGLPMIALGIAVDDTIHFLNRYRQACTKTDDCEAALKSVFATTGRSIVISTLALCAGLFPLAFAEIISLWMIGTYLVVGILGALIADLLCLPAMIKLGLIRY